MDAAAPGKLADVDARDRHGAADGEAGFEFGVGFGILGVVMQERRFAADETAQAPADARTPGPERTTLVCSISRGTLTMPAVPKKLGRPAFLSTRVIIAGLCGAVVYLGVTPRRAGRAHPDRV